MRRVLQLMVVIAAIVAVQAPADAAYSTCFGCGSRMIDDGYSCSTGDVVVHEGGFFMDGWYGYKNADHTQPMCGSCNVHNRCLWGALEAEQAAQYAFANGGSLIDLQNSFKDFVQIDYDAGSLTIIGCEGKPIRVFDLHGDVLQA
jgi:hypothetical protein